MLEVFFEAAFRHAGERFAHGAGTMLAYTINITQILQGCGHERLQSAEPFDEAFGNCVRNSGDAVKQAVAARLQGSVEFVIAEPCGLGDHSEVHNIHVGKVAQSPSCDGDGAAHYL